jgi:hypothetical protein
MASLFFTGEAFAPHIQKLGRKHKAAMFPTPQRPPHPAGLTSSPGLQLPAAVSPPLVPRLKAKAFSLFPISSPGNYMIIIKYQGEQ